MEEVVLIDEQNNQIGTMPKTEVHSGHTPLHRGFSIFIFNSKCELLLQQRALSKKTFPGVWSNSCCGHPNSQETPEQAANRRVKEELGISLGRIYMILPHYRYRTEMNGIWENEICPVMIAFYDGEINVNPDEVEAIEWIDWEKFLARVRKDKNLSAWCREEALLLNKNEECDNILKSHTKP